MNLEDMMLGRNPQKLTRREESDMRHYCQTLERRMLPVFRRAERSALKLRGEVVRALKKQPKRSGHKNPGKK